LESALFINSFDSKDSNFKNQATTTSRCHHRGNEEKNRKKNQNQNPIPYISILVVMTKRKERKKHLFWGTLIHTKKTVIVSLSHFT